MSLWKVLAYDMGQRCSVDTTLDFQEVERRTECEGDSFLTITLPELRKATEKWLDQGYVDAADAPGFRFRQKLPIFMGGFFRQLFCPESGAAWPEPSEDAFLAIRQLCGFYGKMFLPSSEEAELQALAQYVATDVEVDTWQKENRLPVGPDLKRPDSEVEALVLFPEHMAFLRISGLLFHRVFDRVNRDLANSEVTPKHGPGATADFLKGNQKFKADWNWRLEEYFPSDLFLLPSPRYASILDEIDFRTPELELPSRVLCVPKTKSAPRVIAAEPVCMQYTQQAVSIAIRERLNEDKILKGFLRLERQEVNQLLAREGSITGALATLDLSEASDRIPNELVRFMTGRWGHLDGAIQACRSRRAVVRTGSSDTTQVVELAKFASMGSALTFPIESMVFLAVVLVGIEASIGRTLTRRDILRLRGKVAVYGDDIVVPTDHVGSVVHALESFGFKVNSSKSFWTGRFRESCGKDYLNGVDVSYVKFRKEWPDDRRSVSEIVALVSLFNQCKDNHYTETTNFLRGKLLGLLDGYFPRVSRDSEILGEWDDFDHDVVRMCPNRHIPLSRGWVIKEHVPYNPLDGERALLKFFLKSGDEPLGRDHLLRSGRSSAVSIKLRNAAT